MISMSNLISIHHSTVNWLWRCIPILCCSGLMGRILAGRRDGSWTSHRGKSSPSTWLWPAPWGQIAIGPPALMHCPLPPWPFDPMGLGMTPRHNSKEWAVLQHIKRISSQFNNFYPMEPQDKSCLWETCISLCVVVLRYNGNHDLSVKYPRLVVV